MARPPLRVEALTHAEATRKNAPTAELEALMDAEQKAPIRAAYARRNPDLDPQLVWRGKDVADWSDLVVNAPPLYIQEKVHPKALIEDLRRATRRAAEPEAAPDLFADFNGIEPEARTEFYQHDQHWSNRMILGDALQVMASLAEREGMKGQVQCIYIDPPYGIKFNSNFQWSTTSRDVKDGKADHLTREPEQVKAFRDTWRDGIHSYLTYLRNRLTVARDLLHESGSIFVQIGDENVHRVRALMDEVFGDENFVVSITVKKKGSQKGELLENIADEILFYARDIGRLKFRHQWLKNEAEEEQVFSADLTGGGTFATQIFPFEFRGRTYRPSQNNSWKTSATGMARICKADRIIQKQQIRYARRQADFGHTVLTNIWEDTGGASDRIYVVQTAAKIVQRCILMTTDPGDLVLDPTCGSGTTAFVAEQWGRRWIMVDTSRVALPLARVRIMGARYPWYLLADSREGQVKEGEVTRTAPRDTATAGRLRQGFVYRRVPHITLKSIANNAEIDTIWEGWQAKMEPVREALNAALKNPSGPLRGPPPHQDGEDRDHPPHLDGEGDHSPLPANGGGAAAQRPSSAPDRAADAGASGPSTTRQAAGGPPPRQVGEDLEEWQVPREAPAAWPDAAKRLLPQWWSLRIARQKEIDASIAAKAETEYLYDQPYTDPSRVRVAGPFTVESLSPHRVPAVDIDDSLFDEMEAATGRKVRRPETGNEAADFAATILAALTKAGVQQAHKEDRIKFEAMTGWPGRFICAEGQFTQTASDGEGGAKKRAGILIGPEYGTVARDDLMAAARECADAGFDLLIACAFNYDAHASEVEKLGRIAILKSRINPDLHMPELADTGAGNLFTVFGEPDIRVHDEGSDFISIEIAGVDMYKGGAIESSSADEIAVWFVDTDYDYESFFVRHAYFPGTNDPYKALRTTLKAEIDEDAWASLKRTRSRPFPKPPSGQVAVKVINHLGDEVMKVVGVQA